MSETPASGHTEIGETRAATLAAANVHIYRNVRDADDGKQQWDFVCECGQDECHEQVLLSVEEFAALRSAGNSVLAPGHVPSQLARAEVLIANAEALRRQAQHQVKRATKNLRARRDSDQRG
jgi:hypothetical protein